MLAAAAMNFKRMMNIWKDNLLALFIWITNMLSQILKTQEIYVQMIY